MASDDESRALATWHRRKHSMPTVPGGQGRILEVLRNALEAIAETSDRHALIPWPSSQMRKPVTTIAKELAPAGLLKRLPDGRIELTDQAAQWLSTADDSFLIRVFHENIRFVGEFLAELQACGLNREKIRQTASQKYQLGWQGHDQVVRRCVWLQITGMVELRYDHNVVLTEAGRSLLETLNIFDPIALNSTPSEIDPSTFPVGDTRIQEILDNLTDESLRDRLNPSLYIPKGLSSQYDSSTSLRIQLEGIRPKITRIDYTRLCAKELNSTESSAASALATLCHIGLVRQTGFDTFETTNAANAWLESDEYLDLVRIFHAHIRCFGELIVLLDKATSVTQLTSDISARYGVEINSISVRQRLLILRECGMVDTVQARKTYVATPRGRAFASTLRLEDPLTSEDRILKQAQTPTDDAGTLALVEQLKLCAKDPERPAEFEKVVAAAFRKLGISAEHLGSSGETDVLITINRTPTSQVRIIVDAKATSHASVLEKAVDFTTLKEHRRKYEAEYVALVAIGFEAGRIMSRARDDNVALISVDHLAAVLMRHEAYPLTPLELLTLFDAQETKDPWAEADRRNALIAATTQAIAEEAEYVDQSGENFLVKDIHKSVRRGLDPTPSMDEIRNILDFLASPLIEGVIRDGKDGYQPGITAEGITARLHALANAIAKSIS